MVLPQTAVSEQHKLFGQRVPYVLPHKLLVDNGKVLEVGVMERLEEVRVIEVVVVEFGISPH